LQAFDDTWTWDERARDTLQELRSSPRTPEKLRALLAGLDGAIHATEMMAYVSMMAIRLIELHRVLKPTGSLYLHCDPTASHYLKLVLALCANVSETARPPEISVEGEQGIHHERFSRIGHEARGRRGGSGCTSAPVHGGVQARDVEEGGRLHAAG
jgi:hypothetical protein